MRRNLLWLILVLVMAAYTALSQPRWEYQGISLGGAPLPDDGEVRGYCGNMVIERTANCDRGSWQDRDDFSGQAL